MDETKKYKCSNCKSEKLRCEFDEFHGNDRKRDVTSQCKQCRSSVYFQKRYPNTVCFCCSVHKKLDKNSVCSKCNADTGIRECRKCKHLLPMFLDFYGNRKVCVSCFKLAKKLNKAA